MLSTSITMPVLTKKRNKLKNPIPLIFTNCPWLHLIKPWCFISFRVSLGWWSKWELPVAMTGRPGPGRMLGAVWPFRPPCPSVPSSRASWCLQGLECHPFCLVKFPRTPAVAGLLCSFVCPAWTRAAVILLRQNGFFPGFLPVEICHAAKMGEPGSIFLSGLRGRI